MLASVAPPPPRPVPAPLAQPRSPEGPSGLPSSPQPSGHRVEGKRGQPARAEDRMGGLATWPWPGRASLRQTFPRGAHRGLAFLSEVVDRRRSKAQPALEEARRSVSPSRSRATALTRPRVFTPRGVPRGLRWQEPAAAAGWLCTCWARWGSAAGWPATLAEVWTQAPRQGAFSASVLLGKRISGSSPHQRETGSNPRLLRQRTVCNSRCFSNVAFGCR
nr:transcription initiation factor TFIID subunit 4-like [Manis javanica]